MTDAGGAGVPGWPIALDASRLDPRQRGEALRRMSEEIFDIIVVGGGVTGCGTALDAATRGLSVALVEMRDYAAGTSSRSGKLIHGGLRYLEQFEFSLVREALRERALMLGRLCPHLVKPVKFIYPLTHRWWERAYVGAGLILYDALGGASAMPRHRHLSRREALLAAPALRPDSLAGAIAFYDAQVDDARHTVTLARTAAAYGAVMASSARVIGFLHEAGRVAGVRVRDEESGAALPVRGRQVISATGAWSGDIQEMLGEHGGLQVRASKGVHILVPRQRIRSSSAILIRAEDSVLFIRPWGRQWLIGTTDTKWHQNISHPVANRSDIEYLLRNVNRIVCPPLTWEDVDGAFAGLRPLLSGQSEMTSRLSREHAVASPVPGLTVVAGGKYTTYRIMARDAVDAAVAGLGRQVPPSCTDQIPLLGAEGYWALWNGRHQMAQRTGLPVRQIEHLLNRYGSAARDLLRLIARSPGSAEPVPGAEDYLKAEVSYAVTHEGALHLDDILSRRLHISSEARDGGIRAAESIASLAGQALGWDEVTVTSELERYRDWVEGEQAAREQSDETNPPTSPGGRTSCTQCRDGAERSSLSWLSCPPPANRERYMRVLCAGDEFITPQMFAETLKPHLNDEAEFVTYASRWPTEPWSCGTEVTEYAGDEGEIAELARDADVLVTHLAPVTERVLGAARRLRIVAVSRGGPVNVNMPAATKRGVPVVNLPGRNARAVAEFTVGILIAGQRNIARSHTQMRHGGWSGEFYRYADAGPELAGRTVGIIGLGQIGRRVAELLRPFGVRLLAADPYIDPDVAAERGVELTGLRQVCGHSDIISLHARLTSETRHMINAETLGDMRQGTYLVNTARGELIEEKSLIEALRSGHLSGAALDVYEHEPLPAGNPLRTMPQVLAVSHLAGASKDVARRAARRLAAEIGRFVRDEPLQHCLNPAVLGAGTGYLQSEPLPGQHGSFPEYLDGEAGGDGGADHLPTEPGGELLHRHGPLVDGGFTCWRGRDRPGARPAVRRSRASAAPGPRDVGQSWPRGSPQAMAGSRVGLRRSGYAGCLPSRYR